MPIKTHSPKPDQIEKVKKLFRPDFFSDDPHDLTEYGKDWTKIFDPKPSLIAFPKTTEEVSKLMKFCNDECISVVPSGGRTGLAGGAIAAHGEIVLSLSKMDKMYEVNELTRTVRVQAGAITEAVHKHCEAHGLTWPVDFGSKGSSHVGGNISTNAGGIRVIRYGLTRQWVLGLQVVLPTGMILELNGDLEKNNTGPDLKQMFIGSEGILGIVTEATLKLTTVVRSSELFLFATDGIESVLNLFLDVRRQAFTVLAFECMSKNCVASVESTHKLKTPFHEIPEYTVMLEVETQATATSEKTSGTTEKFDAWLAGLFERVLVLDGTKTSSHEQTHTMWRIRELITESMRNQGLVHKHDISVPIAKLSDFLHEFVKEAKKEGGEGLPPYVFGHIGDGNLHINFLKPTDRSRDEFYKATDRIDDRMFHLVQKNKGSVSAEHGIGLNKKNILHFTRTKDEIELMRGMKKLFDPKGILNPGKIFD